MLFTFVFPKLHNCIYKVNSFHVNINYDIIDSNLVSATFRSYISFPFLIVSWTEVLPLVTDCRFVIMWIVNFF